MLSFEWMCSAHHSPSFRQSRREWHNACCNGDFYNGSNACASEIHRLSYEYFREHVNPDNPTLHKNYLSLVYLFCNHFTSRGHAGWETAQMLATEAIKVTTSYERTANHIWELDFYEYVRARLDRHLALAKRHEQHGHPLNLIDDHHRLLNYVIEYGTREHYAETGEPTLRKHQLPKYRELLCTAYSDLCRTIYRHYLAQGCTLGPKLELLSRSYFSLFVQAFDMIGDDASNRIIHLDTHRRVSIMRLADPDQIRAECEGILKSGVEKTRYMVLTEELALRETIHVTNYLSLKSRGVPNGNSEWAFVRNNLDEDIVIALRNGYNTAHMSLCDIRHRLFRFPDA